MRYSEIPAHFAPVFWMEVDGKRALCAVPIRSLCRLRMASSACPWDRCASGKSAVHGRQQTGWAAPRIRGRETFTPPLPIEEVQRHNFSQKCNRSSGSPGTTHLPAASDKVVSQRTKEMLLYIGTPPPFCPFCSYKHCLRKAERVCRRREEVYVKDCSKKSSEWLTRGVSAPSSHNKNGLTQRHEQACAEVNGTVPLPNQRRPPAALSQKEQQRNSSLQRLFLLINKLHYLAAAIDSL